MNLRLSQAHGTLTQTINKNTSKNQIAAHTYPRRFVRSHALTCMYKVLCSYKELTSTTSALFKN